MAVSKEKINQEFNTIDSAMFEVQSYVALSDELKKALFADSPEKVVKYFTSKSGTATFLAFANIVESDIELATTIDMFSNGQIIKSIPEGKYKAEISEKIDSYKDDNIYSPQKLLSDVEEIHNLDLTQDVANLIIPGFTDFVHQKLPEPGGRGRDPFTFYQVFFNVINLES